jgi:hypothetical protein
MYEKCGFHSSVSEIKFFNFRENKLDDCRLLPNETNRKTREVIGFDATTVVMPFFFIRKVEIMPPSFMLLSHLHKHELKKLQLAKGYWI